MSRLDLLTIAIVIVCLGALGYLVYKIVKLMNPPEEGPTTSIQDTYSPPENDDSTYNYGEAADSAGTTDYDADLDDDEVTGTYSEDEYDNSSSTIAEESSSNTVPETEPVRQERINTTTTATATGGRYMVIAGSYRQRANADNQASRLRRMGYSSTEVELFDRGSYAVVLVDRFDNLTAAQNLIRELANKGVDSFVKLKD